MLAENWINDSANRAARAGGARPHGGRLALVPAYSARQLRPRDVAALDAAYRLRQAVFARELSWVPAGHDGRERDRCDLIARHFAVYAGPPAGPRTESQRAPLVAYARVLIPDDCLMLQREFAVLLANEPFAPHPRHAFEVSRFVVHPRYRGQLGSDGRSAVEHLGRAIARWAHASSRTEWLSVCELRHVRALRLRGLPFERFGRTHEYQPGAPVCAARLDLEQAATRLREHRPADYAWYATAGEATR